MYGERSQLPLPVRYFKIMRKIRKLGLLGVGMVASISLPIFLAHIGKERQNRIAERMVEMYDPIVHIVDGEARVMMTGPTPDLNGTYIDNSPYGSLDEFFPSPQREVSGEDLNRAERFYGQVYSDYLSFFLRN